MDVVSFSGLPHRNEDRDGNRKELKYEPEQDWKGATRAKRSISKSPANKVVVSIR
jgi:hypothetical protein